METIGERIKTLRKANDMTQKEFADHIGVSRSTLAGYETCKIEPSLNVIFSMANKFGISPSYFLRTMAIEFPAEDTTDDILDKLDELMNLTSTRNIKVDNKIVEHDSDLSKLIYYELKKTRNSIIQFTKILKR